MSVSVTFNGVAYSIPEDGETGWAALTDYLVALSGAQTATALKSSVRTVTVTPSTAQATDCVLLCGSGASVINLPVGVRGQFYAIFDKDGDAATTPLTVNAAGGDTIQGAASYTIKSNRGGVLIQYADTGNTWEIISEIKDIAANLPRIATDATNASFVRAAVVPESTAFVTVPHLHTCSASFVGSKAMHIIVSADNHSIYLMADYGSAEISALTDKQNLFRETDTGNGIYIYKSANSATINFKSRISGGGAVIEIRALTNQITNVTGWV